jgi:hypothetical protein
LRKKFKEPIPGAFQVVIAVARVVKLVAPVPDIFIAEIAPAVDTHEAAPVPGILKSPDSAVPELKDAVLEAAEDKVPVNSGIADAEKVLTPAT